MAIEDVALGDAVLAADPETGESGSHTVMALISGTGEKDLTTVSTDAGEVVATANHPLWSPSAGAWVAAGELEAGDTLLLADGTAMAVTAVADSTAEATVHNLTIADLHTYYVLVGDEPVLAHNCGETNLASNARTAHILDGEVYPNGAMGGGHRPGTGFSGKSEFGSAPSLVDSRGLG